MTSGAAPHHVVVLLYDGLQMLDVAGPVDAFASADALGASYHVTHASLTGADVTASSGARHGADAAIDELPGRIGTLLIPGSPHWQRAIADSDLVDAVRTLAHRSGRTVSICAGAFPLAATGLLDGRRVATHWKLARHLSARFPALVVDSSALFVRDGHFVTSAGVTAGIDLTLSLIERDHGSTLAREVARDLVVFMARPGDQSQFSVRLETPHADDSVVRTAMDAVTRAPALDHALSALAARVGVSGRHLSRLFLAETGGTPQHFVDRTRLEAACGLLVDGQTPIDEIAERTGVGTGDSLRRLFHRELGITPSAYRQRFKTTTGRAN